MGFIALPGGYGTFEEIFEAVAWATARITIQNLAPFITYAGILTKLIDFLDNCLRGGFPEKKSTGNFL